MNDPGSNRVTSFLFAKSRGAGVRPDAPLKRSASGTTPDAGRWYPVNLHRPGRGVLPLSPAWLERENPHRVQGFRFACPGSGRWSCFDWSPGQSTAALRACAQAMLEGEATLLMESPSGLHAEHGLGKGLVVVPRGVCHTANMRGPWRMLHIAMGRGTRSRPAAGEPRPRAQAEQDLRGEEE